MKVLVKYEGGWQQQLRRCCIWYRARYINKRLTANGADVLPKFLAPKSVECAKSERVETDSDLFVSAGVARSYLLYRVRLTFEPKFKLVTHMNNKHSWNTSLLHRKRSDLRSFSFGSFRYICCFFS